MAQIKINNIIYGSNNASDITYRNITVEEKLDTIPVFDPSDNINIENAKYDYLTYGHIIDSLNSSETSKTLSANQGKVLNEKIDNIERTNNKTVTALDSRITNNINDINGSISDLNTNISNNKSLIDDNTNSIININKKSNAYIFANSIDLQSSGYTSRDNCYTLQKDGYVFIENGSDQTAMISERYGWWYIGRTQGAYTTFVKAGTKVYVLGTCSYALVRELDY